MDCMITEGVGCPPSLTGQTVSNQVWGSDTSNGKGKAKAWLKENGQLIEQ
jgi:hypothetical protein